MIRRGNQKSTRFEQRRRINFATAVPITSPIRVLQIQFYVLSRSLQPPPRCFHYFSAGAARSRPAAAKAARDRIPFSDSPRGDHFFWVNSPFDYHSVMRLASNASLQPPAMLLNPRVVFPRTLLCCVRERDYRVEIIFYQHSVATAEIEPSSSPPRIESGEENLLLANLFCASCSATTCTLWPMRECKFLSFVRTSLREGYFPAFCAVN